MSQSNVYFTNLRIAFQENLLQRLERPMEKAGMLEDIGFNNKYTAIKVHFGEPGNLSHLHSNYSRVTMDLIKSQSGKVFLTDRNTLYIGGRKNALDHLDAAYEDGYNPFATGCHVLTIGGLKGTDETLIPIGGEHIKEAKIGRAVMNADISISLTHSKGHGGTGSGGTMRNIGVGCGSRVGKMEMYNVGKPHVVTSKCVGCGAYQKNCAHSAITTTERGTSVDHDKRVGCDRYIGVYPMGTVDSARDESNDVLNCKIAEYTCVVLRDRPHSHINLVVDVSPYCDCHAKNDMPIVPNVGMFVPFDPVALDMACVDAVNHQPMTPSSILSEKPRIRHDHLIGTHLDTNWESAIDHVVKMGLGNKEYNLITI